MSTWTLTRTRGTSVVSRSLTQWGISRAVIATRSLAVSELTFQIKRADVLAPSDFEYNDVVSLQYGGEQRFFGKMKKLPALARGAADELDSYVVEDPWGDLTRLFYMQPRQIANVADDAIVDYSEMSTSRVTLGAHSTTGAIIAFGTQIQNVVAFAIAYGVKLQQGTIPDFRTIPIDVGQDITCAEAIKRCLSYLPDAVGWFDYSTTPPTFNINKRDALEAVEIDVTDADLISEFNLTCRRDIVPSGVTFIYVRSREVTEEIAGITVTRSVDDTFTDVGGAGFGLDGLVATIELSRINTGGYEPFPAGLASYYYEQLAVPQYEGAIHFKAESVPSTLRLGQVLNLTNGRTEWATMNAMVQSAIYNLDDGTLEIELGTAEFLGARDFVDLMLFNRRLPLPPPKPLFPLLQPQPDPDNPDPQPGGNSNPQLKQKQIPVCRDGVLTQEAVYGP